LFPANTFPRGPKRAPPTAEESERLKKKAAEAILGGIPKTARRVYFASDDEDGQLEAVLGWLDLLGDGYLNRHLVFGILELLVVRIMPEITEKGVGEMLDEKLGMNGPSL
jgi:hypothetical protein